MTAALKVESAILDGEVVTCDETGRLIFLDLLRSTRPPTFVAFDLMWLNGEDLQLLPLRERKARLATLLPARSQVVQATAVASEPRPCRRGFSFTPLIGGRHPTHGFVPNR